MAVLLVDTVGFVSRLPHNLVEAFKSTLEEAAWSDVILQVADASDPLREEQLAVTAQVLDSLDCADIPRITLYNKCDKPGAAPFDPDILLTSAKTGLGLGPPFAASGPASGPTGCAPSRCCCPTMPCPWQAPCASGAAS